MTMVLWLVFSGGAVSLKAQIEGGMLDPAIDPPGLPFSYFSHPTDVLGVMDFPIATEVTPEGYLYTGFGELMFFVGNPPEPVNQRIKTLHKGYLPIVEYEVERQRVRYHFKMFTAVPDESRPALPVNFVEVQMQNEAQEDRTAFVSSAFRYSPPTHGLGGLPEYRFAQRFDLLPKEYTEGQKVFNPQWRYAFTGNAVTRDGRIIYLYPTDPEPYQKSLSLIDNGLRKSRFFTGEIVGGPDAQSSSDPHSPLGVVLYRVPLKPGESRSLIFKMPVVPLPGDSADAGKLEKADYAQAFENTVKSWDEIVETPPLQLPETKVQDFLQANTITELLATDKIGNDYVTGDNRLQYHESQGGCDTNFINVALDYFGAVKYARRSLLYSIKAQTPGGYWVVGPAPYSYWETFGCTLWGWGRHYLLTRDLPFLRQIYPSLLRAVEWESQITRSDPLGLMPVSTNGDNAWLKDAHQTGQDIWTLVGLRNAIMIADTLGQKADSERFQAEYQRFRKAFEKQLATQTKITGGRIPPALDRTVTGNEWDNLLTLFPEPLFAPFDDRVTATILNTRKTYAEGILPFILPSATAKQGDHYTFNNDPMIIYWQTPDNAENELVRDDPEDQALAVQDLYALLLHTTSTHAPQEFGTWPWGTRDIGDGGDDLLPDSLTSGTIINLIRNMLVREYNDDLILFSALSPAWLQPGQQIEIRKEPTSFGPISATLKSDSDGWDVQLSDQFRQAPQHLMITIPWYYEVQAVEADGKPVQVTDGTLVLDPTTRHVHVRGKIKSGTPMMSYESAVEDYKREYKQRYEEFLRTGTTNVKR